MCVASLATAFACGGTNQTAPSEVYVPTSPPLSSLSIFPPRQVTKIGETPEPQVAARDLAGAQVPDVLPAYTSSNPAAVMVQGGRHLRAVGVGTATIRATAGGQSAEFLIHVGSNVYDPSVQGPARALSANYIDLSKIGRISRFRSTIGHTYGPEPCRSMKHYFEPRLSVDWTSVDIYAPATGTIWTVASDGWGYRVMLRPLDLAAVDVALFHVNVNPGIVKGTWVEAGQHIGRHATRSTMSDIAVTVGSYDYGDVALVLRSDVGRRLRRVPGERRPVARGGHYHQGGARRRPDTL
jgi:hypothetical protein